jgi:senataxin
MRFKGGIKTLNGEEKKVNIVRLGRGDAINANVQDVTLEALVNKKLGMNLSNDKDPEATRKLFQQHKETSERLRQAQDQMNTGEVKGADASKLQDDIIALRRQKALLGTKIDNTKDAERLEKRNAELNRRRAQEQILNDAHIICGTLSGSGHEMFQNLSIEFETVIVDEAAQCVEMSALIPLKYGCAKCILVGDPKQLPPTVFSKEAARFQYEQSLFVRMQKNHPNDIHLLDTQYRMHPEISLFPSQTFYDGKLLDGGDMAALRKQPWHKSVLLGPYRFFDVQGQHQAAPKGHSLINVAEINIAMQLYRRLTSDHSDYDFRGKVGIITPYKSQLRELKNRFITQYGPTITEDIDFNTTDAFQGRESEVIIFSCVRASPAGGIGFLQDIRRMNVGLTRAKSSLWVLGNSQSLVRGEFWRKLVDDAKSRQRYTDGDVGKMLNKHSSAYPARPGMFDVPVRQAPVKQDIKAEPTSRDGINQPTGVEFSSRIKQEDSHNFSNGKRKHSDDSNTDSEMVDVDMEDVDSESASNNMNGSGTTTPLNFPDSMERGNGTKNDSATPEPTGARSGDVLGGMTKPKIIRRRPREPPNPLITNKRPKR